MDRLYSKKYSLSIAREGNKKCSQGIPSYSPYPHSRKLQFATQIELEGKKESSHPVMGPCAGVLWSTYFYFRYSPTDVKVFSRAVYKVTVRNKPRSVS